MKKAPLLILVAVVAVVCVYGWTSYNGFITSDEKVTAAFAQVNVQYQRRFDLIPNLVSTVSGAADFEQETFTAVTQARSQWQSSSTREGRVDAINAMEGALGRLMVTVESYPQLKATQAFQDLMVQLEGTENRIATARMDYNEAVRQYNLGVEKFPGLLMAGIFGFDSLEYLQSTEGADVAPSVEF